jgi:peptide chain release factor 2
MSKSDFWSDQEAAQEAIREVKQLNDLIEKMDQLEKEQEEIEVMLDLIDSEPPEEQEALLREQVQAFRSFSEALSAFELTQLLHQPYDANSAIIELHPGAGGTESQDWAEMLLRMYTRWAEKNNFQVETLDYQPGDEAGIKSVTLMVKGPYAYGYLRAEKGVHRLVRISPFDASGRRHTSFASLDVMPEIDDDVEVEINQKDLRIDTYHSSGAGGQHVNTSDSAVRITHLPTGIVVTCQSERSQIQNRERAMKVLKARLLEKKLQEQKEELQAMKGEQTEIGWGNQIRSYVFHPYSMVKDHRTQVEVGNVQAVMDGQLQPFIEAYLRSPLNR